MGIYAAGANLGGELGLDKESTNEQPLFKRIINGKFIALSSGAMHSAAIDENGCLWTWGINDDGALFRNGRKDVPTKTSLTRVRQVVCTDSSTVVLLSDKTVKISGAFRNANGDIEKAVDVDLRNITKITAGHQHVLALDGDGKVWVWGGGNRDYNRICISEIPEFATPQHIY